MVIKHPSARLTAPLQPLLLKADLLQLKPRASCASCAQCTLDSSHLTASTSLQNYSSTTKMGYDDTYEPYQPPSARSDDLKRLAAFGDSMQDAYKVEYAKSGRSACNGRQPCKGTLIGDGESSAARSEANV